LIFIPHIPSLASMPKNFAATRPVNPPGVEPKITVKQLWAGLAKKAREPRDFIPNVASVSVLEDSGDKVCHGDGLRTLCTN